MTAPSVAVVGGGLAGLASALALAEREWRVTLFESRRELGGRAGSYCDSHTGDTVDHCQHVGMGCCTNFRDFLRRTGTADGIERQQRLTFIAPDGRQYHLSGANWLPAPLHLLPGLARLSYLTWRERWRIVTALKRLLRVPRDEARGRLMGSWLQANGQSPQAIRRFWSVVLVSALSETVDRISVAAAAKVFRDGFLAAREAYQVDLPRLPLGELYERIATCLRERGVRVRTATPVTRVVGSDLRAEAIEAGDRRHEFDFYVVALPWRRIGDLFGPSLQTQLQSTLDAAGQLQSAPITAVHLWFDRPITTLPHAVLIDRLSQWVFRRPSSLTGVAHVIGSATGATNGAEHYYQVVISASHELAGRPREDLVEEVRDDLNLLGPQARSAQLLRYRVITQHDAVFAPHPGVERLRPPQCTAIRNLALAGDWTRTGWPATMEGAVRSGYLAAEVLLEVGGPPGRVLVPDLPRPVLARWLRIG